ncbi:hypothetical protein B0H66DRAFT_570749 [Apodospora peruviana]|uniref:Uncharacterized protein n=1 Tax=Apodospora peruviana TaxID=516989 RepID=A0AAE0HT91_9PEZI|nr:hypothetical protein B0H66DRAFT_570749 [Apodospora peruviana]
MDLPAPDPVIHSPSQETTELSTEYCDPSLAEQIRHWIRTGDHVIIKDAASKKQGHNTGSFNSASDRPDDQDSCSTSSLPSSTLWLAGRDDDVLIPAAEAITRTYHAAQHTWSSFVTHGKDIPLNCVPREADDPTIMLKDVPSLPNELPISPGSLEGVAIWRREAGKEADPNSQVTSMRKSFSFLTAEPLACRFSSEADADLSTPNGLAILTLCWSYILSMRLLELQNRTPRYSKACLNSITNATYAPGPHDVVLDLRAPASPQLVRWLCAVLAPRLGWCVSGRFPKWATRVDGNISFVIVSDVQVQLAEHPPNSKQATELLVELCDLFGLGTADSEQHSNFASQAPYTAAFLAALAVPLYRTHELKPKMAVTALKRSKGGRMSCAESARIHQYVADLNYYMTLSADTYGSHSTLWSMFWQPDIPCNLVGPWLGGTHDALKLLIADRNVSALTNVFALRRPRVAMWWLGVLLLGSPAVWDDMVIWLETAEGRFGGRGLGAISCPDITFSAWIGSSNTFLDQEVTDTYQCETDLVPRADILRCRFNMLLQSEEWNTSLCWQPFGCVPKKEVEVDLWPSLEHGSTREYVHWIWWVDKKPDIQLGFRHDTGRFVEVCDNLDVIEPQGSPSCNVEAPKRPSIVAVGKMLSLLMHDVNGGVAECTAALPGFEKHKWNKYWNILPSQW